MFDHDFKVAKKLAELEIELTEQKKAVQKLTKDCDGKFDIYMFYKSSGFFLLLKCKIKINIPTD